MFHWMSQTLLVRTRIRYCRALIFALGLVGAIEYSLLRLYGGRSGTTYRVHPKSVPFDLNVRHQSSDADTLETVFVEEEYAPLHDLPDVKLVIDCGANVGYSAAWFLSQFPNCRVLAVEPDPENFSILQRNMAGYGDRVTLIRAGVWSHTTPLVISQDRYRDGREWAKQVRPCRPDETSDLEGISIESLLAMSGFDRISLLKMDVEGAEGEIFQGEVNWLDKVDAIAIELHDDSTFGNCTQIFLAAMEGRGFEMIRSGELTLCSRPGTVKLVPHEKLW